MVAGFSCVRINNDELVAIIYEFKKIFGKNGGIRYHAASLVKPCGVGEIPRPYCNIFTTGADRFFPRLQCCICVECLT